MWEFSAVGRRRSHEGCPGRCLALACSGPRRCGRGAYERVVTSEFALLMLYAQLRREHEGAGHEVRFDERDWQPGEPY